MSFDNAQLQRDLMTYMFHQPDFAAKLLHAQTKVPASTVETVTRQLFFDTIFPLLDERFRMRAIARIRREANPKQQVKEKRHPLPAHLNPNHAAASQAECFAAEAKSAAATQHPGSVSATSHAANRRPYAAEVRVKPTARVTAPEAAKPNHAGGSGSPVNSSPPRPHFVPKLNLSSAKASAHEPTQPSRPPTSAPKKRSPNNLMASAASLSAPKVHIPKSSPHETIQSA